MPEAKTLSVDIVSDVMCPWCYIGKKRLEKAIPLLEDIALDIRWRPFQLDPTLPPQGRDRQVYLETKFGGPDRAKAVYATIEQAGYDEGIRFDFKAIKLSPNTLDAHRVIRWAANVGAQDAVVEALFEAYFLNGQNIGDHDVLVEIAVNAGLEGNLVRDLLAQGADLDLVEKEIELARALGVDGVPCFILANSVAIAGAQDPETLAQAITQTVETQAASA